MATCDLGQEGAGRGCVRKPELAAGSGIVCVSLWASVVLGLRTCVTFSFYGPLLSTVRIFSLLHGFCFPMSLAFQKPQNF